MNYNLGAEKDVPACDKIYVSGILPSTERRELMLYFNSFGSRGMVEILGGSEQDWHSKKAIGKHFCILVCQNPSKFRAILGWPKHYLREKRVFCEPYLTGNLLIKQNNLNNQKRAFIRKIPNRTNVDQLLEFLEIEFGAIESYMDFKDEKGTPSNHYSISVTFRSKENRDQFCYWAEDEGLFVHGEYVLVEMYNRKKMKAKGKKTQVITTESYSKAHNYSHQHKVPHTLRMDDLLLGKQLNIADQKADHQPAQLLPTPIKLGQHQSINDVLTMSKPTSKCYYSGAHILGKGHHYSNIRLNITRITPALQNHLNLENYFF